MVVRKVVVSKGTLRIGSVDLKTYEYSGEGWVVSNKEFPDALRAVSLFKSHNRFKILVDNKNPKFLKGQLSPDGHVGGARINILPSGRKLDKAFSLFSPDLSFHDESSSGHWDVIYRNPNGQFAYVYTLSKKKARSLSKYQKVSDFQQIYSKLMSNVTRALDNLSDNLALPTYTLLKTLMRVGNESYFRAHGHKGLTTIMKKDVLIGKNNLVQFKYLAKDGVPMSINEYFPPSYVRRLKSLLSKIKNNDFLFTDSRGSPLRDTEFMKAFKRYSGKSFYPHIVRSHYATMMAKDFLAKHHSSSKSEIKDFYDSVAKRLGHKKFSKKDSVWKDSSSVTIHYYVQPSIVKKIDSLVKN
jgi:hypothetical protein